MWYCGKMSPIVTIIALNCNNIINIINAEPIHPRPATSFLFVLTSFSAKHPYFPKSSGSMFRINSSLSCLNFDHKSNKKTSDFQCTIDKSVIKSCAWRRSETLKVVGGEQYAQIDQEELQYRIISIININLLQKDLVTMFINRISSMLMMTFSRRT